MGEVLELDSTLFWIGHASFYVKVKGLNIFIDPFNVGPGIKEKADIVLITHAHQDHCDKNAFQKVVKPGTEVWAPRDCLEMLGVKDGKEVKPGLSEMWKGISVSTVPAYNIKSERLNFHPKKNNWVGYVLNVAVSEGDFKIYHAGDTDFIDEMKGWSRYKIDAALLPMGGTYVMTPEEAAEAANAISAKNSVPMHYKQLLGKEGSDAAEKLFKERVKSAHIMKEVQEPKFSF